MISNTTEEIVHKILNKISNNNALSPNAISTGIASLDNTIGGWEHGVTIISASLLILATPGKTHVRTNLPSKYKSNVRP